MEGSGSASSVRVVPAVGPAVPGVGKYRYIATLDEGGMADVYLAVTKDTGFEKIVVIKQLRDALAEDPSFVAMFMDEARLAARLNHPNVVQTLEVGADQGVHFIAMEFLEGVPYVRLARLKERIPAPLAFHVRILVEVLRGLHYAHELRDFDGRPLGVVHRDVSPQNVMLTFEGGVKVLDFGIAKAALAAERRPEDFKGKIEYMAPEQALLSDVDRRADIYCVGIMLWEALTRSRFYEKGEDKYVRLTEGRPRDVLELVPIAPKKLATICARALAYDRNERFATADEMADELEEWLGGTGQYVTARDVGGYVAEKFDERRAKLSGAIGAQLERFRSLGEQRTLDLTHIRTDIPPPPAAPNSGGTLPLMPPPAPSGYPMTATTPHMPKAPRTTRPGGGTSLVYVVAVSALLGIFVLGGGVLLATRMRPTGAAEDEARAAPPASASAAPVASAASGEEAASPAEIDFTVKASPPHARISIDGRPESHNPAVGKRPRDGAMHVVRVEAPGFETREESVAFDRTFLVTIELRPEPPAEPATSASAAAAAEPEPVTKRTKPSSWRRKPARRPSTSKPAAPADKLDTDNPYQ